MFSGWKLLLFLILCYFLFIKYVSWVVFFLKNILKFIIINYVQQHICYYLICFYGEIGICWKEFPFFSFLISFFVSLLDKYVKEAIEEVSSTSSCTYICCGLFYLTLMFKYILITLFNKMRNIMSSWESFFLFQSSTYIFLDIKIFFFMLSSLILIKWFTSCLIKFLLQLYVCVCVMLW